MRAVFLFAVVALTSLALADDELIAPIPARRVTTVDPATGAVTTTETSPRMAPTESDDAKVIRAKTIISLTANTVIIGYGDSEPPLHVAPKAVILCDSFNAESAPGERPKLHCQQCKVTLPNGSTGEAADVEYDTATKMLTLTGTDDQPVKLTSNRDGGGQRIKAAKMEIELDFTPSSTIAPMPAEYAPPSYTPTPAEPFVAPQPK